MFLMAFVPSLTTKRQDRIANGADVKHEFVSSAAETLPECAQICRYRCEYWAGQEVEPASSTCSAVLQPPGCCLDLHHRLYATPEADRECPVLVFSDSYSSVFYP